MSLKKRSHLFPVCLLLPLLLNGTSAVVSSQTVDPPLFATIQQTGPLLEIRQQKQWTEAQLNIELMIREQLQATQAQFKESGNTQQQAAIQVELDRQAQQVSNLFEPATLTNAHVIDTYPESSPTNDYIVTPGAQPIRWSIWVKFDTEGSHRFAELTKNMAGTGRAVGIFINGRLVSVPRVDIKFAAEGITSGKIQISDNFTAEQAEDLAVQLRTQPVLTTEPTRTLRLGYDRLRNQDLQGAITYFTQAIELSSNDPQPYLSRAEGYVRLKNWQLALADYTQVITFSPQKPDIYLQRAKVYEALGQTQLAVADYEKAMQIDGETFRDAIFPPLLAGYLKLGNKSQAIALVEQLFSGEMEPQSPIVHLSSLIVCAIHNYFKDYDQAIQSCSEVLQSHPENTLAAYFRGFAFEQTDRLQQAERDYQAILEVVPSQTLPSFFRENAYIPSIRAIQSSNLVRAYYTRGLAHYRLNNLQEAIADFNQALQLDSSYALAYRARGLVYQELGNLSDANQDFQTAIQLFEMQGNFLGVSGVMDWLLQNFSLTEQ